MRRTIRGIVQYNHRQVRFRLISFAPELMLMLRSIQCWLAQEEERSEDYRTFIQFDCKTKVFSFRYRMIYEPAGKVLNLDL